MSRSEIGVLLGCVCLCLNALSFSEKQYGQKTRIIRVDFTDSCSIYSTIAKELQDLEIGVLGNSEKAAEK